jgi:hypothetical protein
MAVLAAGLAACGGVGDPAETEMQTSTADRELWGVRMELHQDQLNVQIEAPYVADYLDAQLTRMDSGVTVVFSRVGQEAICSISSRRLSLDDAERTMGWGGGVRVAHGDSIAMESDSLLWDSESERLHVPDQLRLQTAAGWERGRELATDVDLAHWQMRDVSGEWQGSDDSLGYRVAISAVSEQGTRVHGYRLEYDSVTVSQDDMVLSGPRAVLEQRSGTLVFESGVSGQDGTYWLAADSGSVDLQAGRLRVGGDVRLEASATPSESAFALFADSATRDRAEDAVFAGGTPVRFQQGDRTIAADSVAYSRVSQRLDACGQVAYRDSSASLTADTLRFHRGLDRITAWGGVQLQAAAVTGTLRAQRMLYEASSGVAVLRGGPTLERARSDTGIALLAAGVMRIDLGQRLVEVSDGMVLTTPDAELRADAGSYSDLSGELQLLGSAVLTQERPADEWQSHLQADSMRVELVDGVIARVQTLGQLDGSIRSAGGRANWIHGSTGTLHMQDGRAQQLDLGGDAEVVCRDPQHNETTRFTGAKMRLEFDADGLRLAWVGGGARLTSLMQEDDDRAGSALNEVTGEELEMVFGDDGVEVRIGAGVDGRYRPQNPD